MNTKILIMAVSLSLPCFAAESQIVREKSAALASTITNTAIISQRPAFHKRVCRRVRSTLRERTTGAIVGTVIGAAAGTGMPIPMGPKFKASEFMVPGNILAGALLGAVVGFVLLPSESPDKDSSATS